MPSTLPTRKDQLHRALFRGEQLALANPMYLGSVRAFLEELLATDLGPGDLTAQSLQLEEKGAHGAVLAKTAGVVAGLDEFAWLYARAGITVEPGRRDGDAVAAGETLLEFWGRRNELLAYERVGLNLVQRMSGIATLTRRLQDQAHRQNPGTQVVATRKTPWGLLDKRAVHLGGGGTHRLGLWDAILVKNNHLALLDAREDVAAAIAAKRVWAARNSAAFLEIEVRSRESALAAARAFRELQAGDADACPCLLLLDNRPAGEAREIVQALRSEQLLDSVLVEASGDISEDNLEAYAACGVDAVSIGALTHSPRALDIRQRLSEPSEEQ